MENTDNPETGSFSNLGSPIQPPPSQNSEVSKALCLLIAVLIRSLHSRTRLKSRLTQFANSNGVWTQNVRIQKKSSREAAASCHCEFTGRKYSTAARAEPAASRVSTCRRAASAAGYHGATEQWDGQQQMVPVLYRCRSKQHTGRISPTSYSFLKYWCPSLRDGWKSMTGN